MGKLLAKKIGMSQVFAEDGTVTPVTEVSVESVPRDLTLGQEVKVTGTSKGKGFQGVVKRWHFAGGPATLGQSDRERHPGSIGMRTTPGRVWKGKKMAGRMGGDTVTVSGQKIVKIDSDRKTLEVSGAVPGARNGKLIIRY